MIFRNIECSVSVSVSVYVNLCQDPTFSTLTGQEGRTSGAADGSFNLKALPDMAAEQSSPLPSYYDRSPYQYSITCTELLITLINLMIIS